MERIFESAIEFQQWIKTHKFNTINNTNTGEAKSVKGSIFKDNDVVGDYTIRSTGTVHVDVLKKHIPEREMYQYTGW